MTHSAHRWTTITLWTTLAATIALGGCGKTESTTATPANTGTGMTGMGSGKDVTGPIASAAPDGAGGAPTFGEATGTGFPSGDAAHAGGQGSGLMGFHGTGAKGTSYAISDTHPAGEPPKSQVQWVLPEQ